MASDVNARCRACYVCATVSQGKPGHTKLHRPDPPKGPWVDLKIDFIGPLPSAKNWVSILLHNN